MDDTCESSDFFGRAIEGVSFEKNFLSELLKSDDTFLTTAADRLDDGQTTPCDSGDPVTVPTTLRNETRAVVS